MQLESTHVKYESCRLHLIDRSDHFRPIPLLIFEKNYAISQGFKILCLILKSGTWRVNLWRVPLRNFKVRTIFFSLYTYTALGCKSPFEYQGPSCLIWVPSPKVNIQQPSQTPDLHFYFILNLDHFKMQMKEVPRTSGISKRQVRTLIEQVLDLGLGEF